MGACELDLGGPNIIRKTSVGRSRLSEEVGRTIILLSLSAGYRVSCLTCEIQFPNNILRV